MEKIKEKNAVRHAVIWIVIYIMLFNIGGMVSEAIGLQDSATGVILLLCSLLLWRYLEKNNWLDYFGLKKITKTDLRKSLLYAPLVFLVLIQFSNGIMSSLSPVNLTVICLMMTGVGFLEELIFRGFLFKAIEEKSGSTRAVVITGITFGLGHIVNLFRGYGYLEQFTQIVSAVGIGIVLALLVVISNNIVPGILFHILFNIMGSISNEASGSQELVGLLVILSIAVAYAFYLVRIIRYSKMKLNSEDSLVPFRRSSH